MAHILLFSIMFMFLCENVSFLCLAEPFWVCQLHLSGSLEVMEMLILFLLGLLYCFFLLVIFSLLKAGNKADQAEERILAIISQKSQNENLSENPHELAPLPAPFQ